MDQGIIGMFMLLVIMVFVFVPGVVFHKSLQKKMWRL
jgi:hypothetical protein